MLPVLAGVAGFVGLMGALAIWKIDRVITVEPDQIADARLMLGLLVATFCLGIATTPLAAGLYVKMRLVEHHLIDLAMEVLRIGLLLGLLFGVGAQAKWVIVAWQHRRDLRHPDPAGGDPRHPARGAFSLVLGFGPNHAHAAEFQPVDQCSKPDHLRSARRSGAAAQPLFQRH